MFYMHNADSIGWGWWLLMSVGMVAFWGLVIWGIVALVRGGTSNPSPPEKEPDRPLEILQRRLARGEISVEEYEKLHDSLIGGARERTPA
jgi:putative membrane protein